MTSSPPPREGHDTEGDRIDLRFDLSADDLDDFSRDAARAQGADHDANPAHPRSARAYFLLTLVLVAVGVSLLTLNPLKQSGSGPEAAAVIALGLFALWTGARALSAALTREPRASASAGAAGDDGAGFGLGAQTMTLGPAGVVVRLEHQDILLRWSGVLDIDRTEHHFYIKRLDRTCFIAPRRAFADHDHLLRTLERCREWHSAFVESESSLVSRLCAGSDVPCPSCSYNLRGHRGGPCPECGVLIDAGAMLRRSLGQETLGTPPPIDLWTIRPARDRAP